MFHINLNLKCLVKVWVKFVIGVHVWWHVILEYRQTKKLVHKRLDCETAVSANGTSS